MTKARKPSSGSSARSHGTARNQSKLQKKKTLTPPPPAQRGGVELVDPRVQAQLKVYDEALALFHQQKFSRAKQELEKVVEGPSKELADRARMHVKIAEQRLRPTIFITLWPRSIVLPAKPIPRWPISRSPSSSARKTAITRAMMRTLLSSRKTRALPNCSIRSKTAPVPEPFPCLLAVFTAAGFSASCLSLLCGLRDLCVEFFPVE